MSDEAIPNLSFIPSEARGLQAGVDADTLAWHHVFGSIRLTDAAATFCFEDLDTTLYVPCSEFSLDPTVDVEQRKIEVAGHYRDLRRFSLDMWSRQQARIEESHPPKRPAPSTLLSTPLPAAQPNNSISQSANSDHLPVSQPAARLFQPMPPRLLRVKSTTLQYVQEKMNGVITDIESTCHVRVVTLHTDDPKQVDVTVWEENATANSGKACDDIEALFNEARSQIIERQINIPEEVKEIVKPKCIELRNNPEAIIRLNECGNCVTVTGQEDAVAAISLHIEESISSVHLESLRPRSRPLPPKPSWEEDKITVKQGDVVHENVDVIVVATPAESFLTSPLRQRVIREAGADVELACRNELARMKGRPTFGRIFVTAGGKLSCRSVIHIILPHIEGNQTKAIMVLKHIYFGALEMAGSSEIRANSLAVALPEITSSGESANALPFVVHHYFEAMAETTTINKVMFVCETLSSMETFKSSIENLFRSSLLPPRSPRRPSAPTNSVKAVTVDSSHVDEKACIICFKVNMEEIYLPCTHSFCKECIADWLKRQTKCPVCAIDVVPSEVLPR